MTNSPLFYIFVCTLLAASRSAIASDPLPSALLPPVGQTVHYGFSDTVTTPKGVAKSSTGTLTLRAVSEDQVHVTVSIDGKEWRDFDLLLSDTEALQPAINPESILSSSNKRRNKGQSEPYLTEQAFIFRLSLAARVCARPNQEVSFPVLLNVPWASGPVNPTLTINPTAPDTFVADANDTTSVNPPYKGKPHIVRTIAISIGVGILATKVGGTAGRIIGPTFAVGSLLYAGLHRSGPLPTDVALHFTGQLADGRLKALSADQEYTVHVKKHLREISDKWTLTAE